MMFLSKRKPFHILIMRCCKHPRITPMHSSWDPLTETSQTSDYYAVASKEDMATVYSSLQSTRRNTSAHDRDFWIHYQR